MNYCQPTSQCKTKRCQCKERNQSCKDNCPICKCNNSKCQNKNEFYDEDSSDDNIPIQTCQCKIRKCQDNRCGCFKLNKSCSDECNCIDCENQGHSKIKKTLDESPKSKLNDYCSTNKLMCSCPNNQCKTNNCTCKKNGKLCNKECKCSDCVNTNSNSIEFFKLDDLASYITKEIRKPVSNKRDEVFAYRNNRDIYTNKHKQNVENPNVDHIIEDQILGHAAAHVLKGQNFAPYLESLKNSLNRETLENYNVTCETINKSKGSIIKNFLKDHMNDGFPLRGLAKESELRNDMNKIFEVMNDTHGIIEEYVAQGTRSDGNVTGNRNFQQIADELANIIEKMDLDIDSEKKPRSRKK